jgi:hypothetical protein
MVDVDEFGVIRRTCFSLSQSPIYATSWEGICNTCRDREGSQAVLPYDPFCRSKGRAESR